MIIFQVIALTTFFFLIRPLTLTLGKKLPEWFNVYMNYALNLLGHVHDVGVVSNS